MESLTDMRVLIIGSTGGIGSAIARTLNRAGCRLVITGRDENRGNQLLTELTKAEFLQADLMNPEEPKNIIRGAVDILGGLDALINCAGVVLSKKLEETTPEEWNRIITINARAPYFLCREALPYLRKSKRPVIVNIGSVVSIKGYPLQSAYTASKHALLGFSKSLAAEVKDEGIRVHAILPGGVNTSMIGNVRPDIDPAELISPEEIAESIQFLLSFRGNGVIDELRIHRASSIPWS